MSAKIVEKKEMVVRDGLTEPLRWGECHVIGKKKTTGSVRNVG